MEALTCNKLAINTFKDFARQHFAGVFINEIFVFPRCLILTRANVSRHELLLLLRHQLLRLRYWRLLARVAAQKCKPPVSGEGGNLPADEPLNEKEFKTPEAANRILLAIECS